MAQKFLVRRETMYRRMTCLASFVLLLGAVNRAFALEPIAGVTATASSSQVTMGPENTVNGSGLNDADEHSATDTDMWLSQVGGPQPAWIQFEFDRVYALREMLVWNSNQTLELFFGFGAKDVTVEYSADGREWIFLKNAEFARAPGSAGYRANTTVDFDGAAVRYVRLTIHSNWGGILPQYGLSEVRFFAFPTIAGDPRPADGATFVDPDVTLRWSPGFGAEQHIVHFGDNFEVVANAVGGPRQVETSYIPGTLEFNRTYYWRVDELYEAQFPAIWQGDVWRFTTGPSPLPLPSKAINLSPANGATNQPIDAIVRWRNGGGATSYRVYFGTDATPDETEYKGGRDDDNTSFEPGTLNYNTTYYWRIDAENSSGATEGDVWRFTTGALPSKPINPSPSAGASNQPIDVILSWENGGGATSYEIYFGTDRRFDSSDNKGTRTLTSYDPGTLNYSTNYFWRIDATNSSGTTTGDVWRFTVQENPLSQISHDPDPPDGAPGVDPLVTLRWSPGFGAELHHVYFGGSSAIVEAGIRGTDKGATSATSFVPGPLELGATYYWRVDEFDGVDTHKGDVWSFTVRPPDETTGAHDPDPLDGATEVNPNVTLRWSAGFGAELHHVYFGGNSAIVETGSRGTDKGTSAATSFVPGPLELGTTCYWRVDEVQADGTVIRGEIWSFTVRQPPPTAYDPDPNDGATGVDPGVTLRWSAGFGAKLHHVYFGGNSAIVEAGSRGTYKGTSAATSFVPDPLELGTTYYWRVDEVQADGTVIRGEIWSFTVRQPPPTAYDPDPNDGATGVDPNVILSWSAGFGAKRHHVYFGDNFAVRGTDKVIQTDTSYNPGPLNYSTTYYWRIDELDQAQETHEGEIWRFTTEALPLPLPPINPRPSNGATNQSIDVDI